MKFFRDCWGVKIIRILEPRDCEMIMGYADTIPVKERIPEFKKNRGLERINFFYKACCCRGVR